MEGGIECSVSENARPYEARRFDHKSIADSGKGKTKEKSRQCHYNLEPPSQLQAVEDTLFSEYIGTESGQKAQIGHDVDQDVLLRVVVRTTSFGEILIREERTL